MALCYLRERFNIIVNKCVLIKKTKQKIIKLLKSESSFNKDYRIKVQFTYLPEGTSSILRAGQDIAVADVT